MELNKSDHDSYEINSKMIEKFSLLSWEWFNFISSKIYHTLIIKDYQRLEPLRTKDNDNKFLLKKPESVKYLKLVNISKLNEEKVNETIKSLVNLKWITSEHNNSIFQKIKFKNFRINSMILRKYEGQLLDHYVKRVDFLHIESQTQTKNIIEAFKTSKIYGFNLELKQNYSQFNITKFPWKDLIECQVPSVNVQTNKSCVTDVVEQQQQQMVNIESITTENRLQWCKDVKFCILNVKMLNEFLKSTPRLRDLTIGICFSNLIYKLYKRYSSNYDEDEPNVLKPCSCSNSFERCFTTEIENSRVVCYDDLFSVYWDEICTMLINHKNLTILTITDRCFNDRKIRYDGIEDVITPQLSTPVITTLEQNQHFFQSFVNLICSTNKSIKTLVINAYDFVQLDIVSILNNSNSTIDTYHFSFNVSTDKIYHTKSIEKVTEYFNKSPNNIIKSFKITNNSHTEFNYNQSIKRTLPIKYNSILLNFK